MKLYTILHPVVFIGVFMWMGYNYCTQDETPPDTTIEEVKAPSI